MEKTYMDSIEFNTKSIGKRSKSILSQLDDFDDEVTLPSSIYMKSKEKKKSKKEEKNIEDDYNTSDEWLETLSSFKTPKIKKKDKSIFDGFELSKKARKKKKKSKNGEAVSHKKEFETEMALLKSLQMDQSKFVDSLQKKYDQMESTKSTARGVGKFTTDLIISITNARSLSMQLIDKIISTKKTIADLDFKERKEFGAKVSSAQQNMSDYASTYLKQVIATGRNNIINNQDDSYSESYNEQDDDLDDIFSSISDSLGDTDRSEDVDKYLKYENDNVSVKILMRDGDDNSNIEDRYEFVAYNGDGEVVDDYPLPEKTKLNINNSTGKASDIYGNKYDIIMV